MTRDEFLTLTRNTWIGVRRTPDGYEVYAPDGYDYAANLIARPNLTANFSAENYARKTARWKALWPEVTVLDPTCRPGEGRDINPTAPRRK